MKEPNEPVDAGGARPPDSLDSPPAPRGTHPDSHSEPVCRCGAGPNPRKVDRCANGHLLRGNRASTIVGQHGATFRREHEAEIHQLADHFARDAGYPTLDAAPLAFQIGVHALARTQKIADLAYWRMLEAGGPLSESGKPRRAYSVWNATNQNLARELRSAIESIVARAPGTVTAVSLTEDEQAELEAIVSEEHARRAGDYFLNRLRPWLEADQFEAVLTLAILAGANEIDSTPPRQPSTRDDTLATIASARANLKLWKAQVESLASKAVDRAMTSAKAIARATSIDEEDLWEI